MERDNGIKSGGKVAILIIAMSILFTISGAVVYILIDRHMPSKEMLSIHEYHSLDKQKLHIVIGTEYIDLEYPPQIMENQLHLPLSFVRECIDPYIFWDEQVEKLTITTVNRVIRMNLDEVEYFENNRPQRLEAPIRRNGTEVYLPASLLRELYDVEIRLEQTNIVTVEKLTRAKLKSYVVDKVADIRHEPTIKSPIAAKLTQDTLLYVYEEEGDFTRVRTELGEVGYVLTDSLSESEVIEAKEPKEKEIPSKAPRIDGKIVLLWDQMTNMQANGNELRRQILKAVNVLSPTWFEFDEEAFNGDIISLADKDYVKFAHDNGYQVWALITDNFKGDVSNMVLSNTETREHVIRQLMDFISEYSLDGINIDFESVREEDSANYVQFFRELYPLMKEIGAVLSVDMYVPSAWSMYYNREEVGKVVDYVCVMTYDEHWGGSETSGPVASINFVDKGIADTLEEVPRDKILMGIPTYVRVWREVESDGVTSHTIRNYGMEYTYNLFRSNGVEFVWLDDVGKYYGEYSVVESGQEVTYKVWLEDERSIELKLEVAKKYDVAGIAVWKRGLETPEVWDLAEEYIRSSNSR